MKKHLAAVAASALALGAFGASGAGARESFAVDINQDTATVTPTGYVLGGYLSSDKKKCRSNRDMKVLEAPPVKRRGSTHVLDTTTSSDNGAWMFQIEENIGNTEVRVAKKTLGNGDVCKAASVSISL